jgi:hypothetical protein
MHCTIVKIKTKKKLLGKGGYLKINKYNYKLTFSNTLYEKSNNDVCLQRHTLVAVIRLIGS